MIEKYFDDPRHRESERVAFDAEQAAKRGATDEAHRIFQQAARLEEAAAQVVPAEEAKVRSLLGISAVSLWLRAADWDEAARAACAFLALPHGLTQGGAQELRALVDRAWRLREMETVVGDGGSYVPLETKLAGGAVRAGLAPSLVVAERRDVLVPLLLRVGEWHNQRKYRKAGPSALAGTLVFYEAPALAASFGLRLLVGQSKQQSIDSVAATPRVIIEKFLELAATAGRGPSALEEAVSDELYRLSFMRSLRDLAPDGCQVGEVTFSSDLPDRSLGRTRFVPEQRAALTKALVATGTNETFERTGALKAINLRGKNPGIVLADGSRFRLKRGQHDDTIGPKLNRDVRVIGTISYDEQEVYWAHDILVIESAH